MRAERMRVTAGVEKNIAVQSPIGSLWTDSNMQRRKAPPRTPWAQSLQVVGVSRVPRRETPYHQVRGNMPRLWPRHLTNSICQALTRTCSPANLMPTLLVGK